MLKIIAVIEAFFPEASHAAETLTRANPLGYAAFQYSVAYDKDEQYVRLIDTITVPMCCFLAEQTNLSTTPFADMVNAVAHCAPENYASMVGSTFD